MALRRIIVKRFCNQSVKDQSPIIGTIDDSTFNSTSSKKPLDGAEANFHYELLKALDNSSSSTANARFFRRFLQQRKIIQSSTMNLSELFYFPVGEKLNISRSERVKLDGSRPPTTKTSPDPVVSVEILVQEARKIQRFCQLQKVRSALKRNPRNSITYSEFLSICNDVCTNLDEGVILAKRLDEVGDVIVLGNVVFIRPDQVVKPMEKLIQQSITIPNDPRKHELEELETKKALIDQKAISQVRGELYCGLGLLVLQTLGFIRLTFWELSWDVMEPICFFFTSLDFAFAYMFFLKTSNEPTFESYFHRRFKVKQKKLMEVHNFDHQKYQQLCDAFYPNDKSKAFSDPVQKLEQGFGEV
ncbi:hypothetical protein L1887_26518 [Cichorium endivia]|nr:hypothetical protein L1887_26518 [Cichorium endivia]